MENKWSIYSLETMLHGHSNITYYLFLTGPIMVSNVEIKTLEFLYGMLNIHSVDVKPFGFEVKDH